MTAYFYPKLSNLDLVAFRSPGPGLGNLLFTWARAEALAAKTGGVALFPTWRNIKIGPYIRREADKRNYGDLFCHRTASELLQSVRARLTTVRRFAETDPSWEDAIGARGDMLVVVEGMGDYFADLAGQSEYIHGLLRDRTAVTPADLAGSIAVHIRTGDFGPAKSHYVRNSGIEVEWFGKEIERVRRELGKLPVVIFTDDTSGVVLQQLGSIDGLSFFTARSALADILSMASASHIVTSNSTFSLWAAYLGKGTVSTKFEEVFSDYRLTADDVLARLKMAC